MVVFVAAVAGYAAVQGGMAAKHKLETRRHPNLNGDFIVAPPETKEDKQQRNSLTQVKRSISKLAQSVVRQTSSSALHNKKKEQDVTTSARTSLYQTGQEVRLQNMQESHLNGMKALILQDFGGNSGVLVQFLEQKQGHDNYHETGIKLHPENIMVLEEQEEEQQHADSTTILPVGTLIELQNLSAHHNNGLRGTVVESPTKNDLMVRDGRVAVQLVDGDDAKLLSIKLENCKVIAFTA